MAESDSDLKYRPSWVNYLPYAGMAAGAIYGYSVGGWDSVFMGSMAGLFLTLLAISIVVWINLAMEAAAERRSR